MQVSTGRKGFTLIELLVALVILSIVGMAAFRTLSQQRRVSDAQTEQTFLQSGIRLGSLITLSEMQNVAVSASGQSDLIALSDTAVTYRAMRTIGAACQVAKDEVRIRSDLAFGPRGIIPVQDSMFLFVERDPNLSSDDSWIAIRITGVTNGSTCGGRPAIALATDIDTTVATGTPLSRIVLDAPVRTFEVMELLMFTQGGQNWLGLHSLSIPGGQAPQEVVGPLAPGGLTLTYLTAAGAATLTPSAVRSVRVTLRGMSDRAVYTGRTVNQVATLQDSLTTVVQLRNSP